MTYPKKRLRDDHIDTTEAEESETMKDDPTEIWKWTAASLFTIIMFLCGFLLGAYSIDSRLDAHVALAGHPVSLQQIADIKESIRRIELAQMRNTTVLNQIYEDILNNEPLPSTIKPQP